MDTTYQVEIVGETVPYGTKRNAALQFARRISQKYPDDSAYVVVKKGDQAIGHIVYCRGFRDSTEGITA